MMLTNIALGLLTVVLTVLIHVFGLLWITQLTSWLVARFKMQGGSLLAMISVVVGLFIVMFAEICVWAICYSAIDALPDFPTSLYFSIATFATLGLGDVVPTHDWRMLGAIESLNGFLMIGWSTAYLISASMRLGPFRAGEHF